jgi:hypothetical protein
MFIYRTLAVRARNDMPATESYAKAVFFERRSMSSHIQYRRSSIDTPAPFVAYVHNQ